AHDDPFVYLFLHGGDEVTRFQNLRANATWPHQQEVLQYLRSGQILGVTMGADLPDWLDRSCKANPIIEGLVEGGTTELTDGTWFWYAGCHTCLVSVRKKICTRRPSSGQ